MTNILGDYGLIFGSEDKVFAWYEDLEAPVLIAKTTRQRNQNNIQSLAFADGDLYYTDSYGNIKTTDPEKRAVYTMCDEGTVPAITFFDKKLIAALEFYDREQGMNLFDITNSRPLFRISNRSSIGPNTPNPLRYRLGVMHLAQRGSKLLVSSENITELDPASETKELTKLTERFCDYPRLISDGKRAYVIWYNSSSGPEYEGRVSSLNPDLKQIATWDKQKKSDGYPKESTTLAALVGDNIILGCIRTQEGRGNPNLGNLYSISITPEMNTSETPIKVQPQLLLENAYQSSKWQLADGSNPILAVKKVDLEKIIAQSARR